MPEGAGGVSHRDVTPQHFPFPAFFGGTVGTRDPWQCLDHAGTFGEQLGWDPGSARSHFVTGANKAAGMCLTKVKKQPAQIRRIFLDKKEKLERSVINPRGAVPYPAGIKSAKFQFTCFPWQRVFSPPWSDAEPPKSLHINAEECSIPPLEALLVLRSSDLLCRLL